MVRFVHGIFLRNLPLNPIFTQCILDTLIAWHLLSLQINIQMAIIINISYISLICLGLIVSGGQDKLIAVYDPYKFVEPDYVLIGHQGNVCALHATQNAMIISGSWDKTAKVWKNWKCVYTLEGHTAAVWAVLIVDENRFLTGSADKTIILWLDGIQVASFKGHTDCVRSICKISDTEFSSCGNDGVIRIWSFSGEQILEMESGRSFIYSLSMLSTKELISSGEDRSVKIWKDGKCIQTIIHPAVSIWSVTVLKNDDIVTGGSDGIIRIFTRDQERMASKEEINEFNKSVASYKISTNNLDHINKEKLPGIEALKKQGKKNQVIMIKANNTIEAYQVSYEMIFIIKNVNYTSGILLKWHGIKLEKLLM